LFIGSCAGSFIAFDKLNGDIRWSYDIRQDGDQANFHGDFHFSDGSVLTATDGQEFGTVYAFDQATGAVRWSHSEPEAITSTVVRGGANVYVVTGPDQVLALDLRSGAVRWRFRTRADPTGRTRLVSSPAVDDAHVYVSGRDGIVYALELAGGAVAWTLDLETPFITAPVLRQGSLYVATREGRMVRVDAASGALQADIDLGAAVYVGNQLSAGDAGIYVYTGIAPGTSAPAELVAVEPSLSAVRWRRASEHGWSTPRAYYWNGEVFVGDAAGNVLGLDPADGSPIESLSVDGQPRSIGTDGDLLFLGTIQGMLYAYRMRGDG
jgi:outer membrane protein assembly factor BamB